MAVADGDKAENRRRAEVLLREAAAQAADVAILPELWNTGLDMDALTSLAEPWPQGPTFQWMANQARHLGLWVVGSVVERDAQGCLFNAAVAFGPAGECLPPYRKIHLFPPMQEHRAFTPGTQPGLWGFPWGQMSVAICYDLRFPELFRVHVEDVLGLWLVAAWPKARREHWRLLVQARAVENLYFVVAVNRVGEGCYGPFGGHSMVVDPWGTILLEADESPGVFVVDIDWSETQRVRKAFPALASRRIRVKGPQAK